MSVYLHYFCHYQTVTALCSCLLKVWVIMYFSNKRSWVPNIYLAPNTVSSSLCIFNTCWCILDYFKGFEAASLLLFWWQRLLFLFSVRNTARLLKMARQRRSYTRANAWHCPWSWNEPLTLSKKLQQWNYLLHWKADVLDNFVFLLARATVWVGICIHQCVGILEGWRYVRAHQGPDSLSQLW